MIIPAETDSLSPDSSKINNVINTIGKTPIVEIKKIKYNPKTMILAKLESFNPGGSVKDRVAARIIGKAIERKELARGKIIIEATSGNTGIGLSLVGRVNGYNTLLVMPSSVSTERINTLKAYGSEIILTPSEKGTDGAIDYVKKIIREFPNTYFHPNQFGNPENVNAHYYGTGSEIAEQVDKADYFIAGVGTGGTLMGVGKRLREEFPGVRIIGVEPSRNHRIQGLRNMSESETPKIFDKNLLDETMNVSDEEAFGMTRKLLETEGLFVGLSSGAVMSAAVRKSWEVSEGVIVVIFPDGGAKYLSTGVFSKGEET